MGQSHFETSDAVLTSVRDNISFELFMDLRNILLTGSSELFPKEAVEKAIEKSSQVLHDEAIRKAVSQDKLAKKFMKQLKFSQSSWQLQSSKCSGRCSSSAPLSGSKAPSPSSRCGRGKKF